MNVVERAREKFPITYDTIRRKNM